jgi:hypothetical protein
MNLTGQCKSRGSVIPGRLYKINTHCSCAVKDYSFTYFGMVLRLQAFITATLDGDKSSNSHPSTPTLKKYPLVCVDAIVSLDAVENGKLSDSDENRTPIILSSSM